MTRIVVRIDRIVLDSGQAAGRESIAGAVHAELAQWLAEPGAIDQLRLRASDRDGQRGAPQRPSAAERPSLPAAIASGIVAGIRR